MQFFLDRDYSTFAFGCKSGRHGNFRFYSAWKISLASYIHFIASEKSIRINGSAAIEKSFDTPAVTECLLLDGRFGTQVSAVAYIVVSHGSVEVKD